MADTSQEERTLPVFLVNNQLPGATEKPFSTVELCKAAEKTTGFNTVDGAQRIRGLWRIYVKNNEARLALLVKGLTLRGSTISPRDTNPFVVSNKNGEGEAEIPTTKLFIGDLPLSCANQDILPILEKLNLKIRSRIIEECARDENGKLTRFKTGRRMVYIEIPVKPLPKEINIGRFRATLYHKEMRVPKCSKCLASGHHASICPNPVKCKQCFQDGHVAGDEVCELSPTAHAPAPPQPADTVMKQPQITALLKEKQTSGQNTKPRSRSFSPRIVDKTRHRSGSKRRSSRSPSPDHQQTQSKAARIKSPTRVNQQQSDKETTKECTESTGT